MCIGQCKKDHSKTLKADNNKFECFRMQNEKINFEF